MIELDRIADEYIRSHGGVPTSKGYKGFPAATCISPERHDRPRDPGRLPGARGRHHLRRHRRHQGRPDRRLRRHLRRRRDLGRGAAAARRLPRGARGRDRGRAARRDGRRHLARRPDRSSRTPASRSSAASSATASASPTTRTRRCRTSSPRTAGPSCVEGMTIAIEPMITAGGPDVYLHDDELVDLDRRRVARGPLRAHRRDHRGRPARAHEGRTGPGTMTGPRRKPCLFLSYDT